MESIHDTHNPVDDKKEPPPSKDNFNVERKSSGDPMATEPPKDNHNLVYFICCWLGIAMLFPWNFFISVDAYWRHKFRNPQVYQLNSSLLNSTENNESNDMLKFWGSWLSLVSMAPNFFFLFLNAIFGHKLRIKPRLYLTLIFNVLVFVLLTVFTQIKTLPWQLGFFYTALAIAMLLNSSDSIFQGAFAAMMGRFPPSYMSALSQGQAIGGTISALVTVVFLAVSDDVIVMALFSFIFAAVFLTSAGILLYVGSKKEFFKYYAPNEDSLKAGTDGEKVNFGLIIRETWVFNLAVFLNMFVTLGVFPTIPVLAESTSDNEKWQKYFLPVGLFFAFNVCDLIGRVASTLTKWPKPNKVGSYITLGMAVSRIVFIPLFMFCNVRPDDRINSDVIDSFKSDTVYIIIVVLFGLTSGYVNNVCMTCTPKMVKDPENQGVAASIMICMLVSGLFAGAGFSFVLVLLL